MSPTPHERAHRPSGPHGHPPAPSLADFEAMAARAFARLPANFRALCEDLVIRVDEFPSPEVLAHMGLSSPYDLLGLFQGIGLPFRPETGVSGLMPNMIWLYRRPILAYWRRQRTWRRQPGGHRHPRAGARDRPPFRLLRRRHGSYRGGPD